MSLGSWRPVLRMAWRDATRARVRSLLVVALIALPIVALTGADVVYRTYQISPLLNYERTNGAATAELTWIGAPVSQDPTGTNWSQVSGQSGGGVGGSTVGGVGAASQATGGPPPRPAALARLLGPGAVLIERRTLGGAEVVTRSGLGTPTVIGVDYSAPIAAGIVRQLSGRAPRSLSETAITSALAGQTGARIGATIHLHDPSTRLTVVGIVADATSARDVVAYVLPGATVAAAGGVDYLAHTPHPVSWRQVRSLDAAGYVVASRQVIEHPPPPAEVSYRSTGHGRFTRTQVVSGGLLAGLALLEVVLLAGPAFATLARRQERAGALLAVAGGSPSDLRGAVLAQALVLGGAAGIGGVAAGLVAGGIAVNATGHLILHRPGPLALRPVELAGILAVGEVTALAAALVPARAAARLDVVAALAGRRPRRPAPARVPLAALALAGVGVAVAVVGAHRSGATVPILAGVTLVELGLIMATPTLLLGCARLGHRFPVPVRLALRDAGRNRSSAAPAVAAVMAAMIGAISVLVGVTTQTAADRRSYQPFARRGQVVAYVTSAAMADGVRAAMAATLPAAGEHLLSQLGASCGPQAALPVPTPGSAGGAVAQPCVGPPGVSLHVPGGQARTTRWTTGVGTSLVTDAAGLRALTGVDDQEAAVALDRGGAVVFDDWAVRRGWTEIDVTVPNTTQVAPTPRTLRVPAVVQRGGFVPAQVVLSPTLAGRLGYGVTPEAVLADDRRVPDTDQVQSLRAALAGVAVRTEGPVGVPGGITFQLEQGFRDRHTNQMLLLSLAAGLLAVGAAVIATGLSNSDRTEDLATLEAVGASPRGRRALSLSRAATIAGVGAMIGTAAAFVPVLAWMISSNRALPAGPGAMTETQNGAGSLLVAVASPALHLTVPWVTLLVLLAGIPAVAATLAGAFSRSTGGDRRSHL